MVQMDRTPHKNRGTWSPRFRDCVHVSILKTGEGDYTSITEGFWRTCYGGNCNRESGSRDTESYEHLQARQDIHPADYLGNHAFYDCIPCRRHRGVFFLYVEGCGAGRVVLVGGGEPGHRNGLPPVAESSRIYELY